jgi:HEAT repeat protein
MKKMGPRNAVVVAVVTAALAVGFWLIYCVWPREPIYRGKRVTVWLEQYARNSFESGSKPRPELAQEAEAAIRRIGAKAAPICLDLVNSREAPWKVKLLKVAPASWLDWLHVASLVDHRSEIFWRRSRGVAGFQILGEDARSAVPGLIRLLRDENSDTRRSAVEALGFVGPVAGEAVPELTRSLQDPDGEIRHRAAFALGKIHQLPERTVPALVKCLKNVHASREDEATAVYAIASLRKFGAQAKEAAPVLRELSNDPVPDIRLWVRLALEEIDAESAAAKAAGR